jgi:phenylacetate-CoA ligase
VKQIANPSEIALPPSDVVGVAWPALPHPDLNAVFSLAYQLERSQWWTTELLTAFQLRQAESLLAHAKSTVPYYRERLTHVANTPPGTMRMDDFRQIPLLRRSEVQNRIDDLKSEAVPVSHLPFHNISTSGSTGRPVALLGSGVTAMFLRALAVRWHTWHNRNLNCKMANIRVPLTSGTATASKRRGWGGTWPGPMVTIGANQPIERQIKWLLAENPHYLATYPSNLKALLQHCAKSGVRISNLREVGTRGEIFDSDVRDYCKQIWGVPVVDSYGANEVGYIALQCPVATHYHIQSENLLVEVLDDEGDPAEAGRTGRVVITDLHNFATPLIRYEIGDDAVMGSNCSCGRGLPVIERVIGRRSRNMFVLPSGDRFWPVYTQTLAQLHEGIPKLLQTQLVQRSRHEITARLVVSGPLQESEESKITKALAEALGGVFNMRLEYVGEIPRTAAGKLFETICEIDET